MAVFLYLSGGIVIIDNHATRRREVLDRYGVVVASVSISVVRQRLFARPPLGFKFITPPWGYFSGKLLKDNREAA